MVMVKWHDAYTHCDKPWHSIEEIEQESEGHAVVHTVGWLLREDDDYLTVTLSVSDLGSDDVDEVGPAITIPRGMIVETHNVGVIRSEMTSRLGVS